MPRYRVAVDTGGTFSDFVYLDEETGTVAIAKIPSTRTTRRAPSSKASSADRARRMRPHRFLLSRHHGRHQRAARGQGRQDRLAGDRGFRGIYEVAEQARPYGAAIFDVMYDQPVPLVPQSLTGEVRERVDFRGNVLVPLDGMRCGKLCAASKRKNRALAVCLLFSFLHPEHERAWVDRAEEMPGCDVSLSSDILPQIREYYRLTRPSSTRICSRYSRAMSRISTAASPAPASPRGRNTLCSRTAACRRFRPRRARRYHGVVGTGRRRHRGRRGLRQTGFANLITFDMGGTSCDVALIKDGGPIFSTAARSKATTSPYR